MTPLLSGRSSIKRKMTVVTLLTCGFVLLAAVSALFLFEGIAVRQNFKHDLAALTDITAANVAAAVEFENSADASDVLRSLSAEPFVDSALIMKGGGGAPLARFGGAHLAWEDVIPTGQTEWRFGGFLVRAAAVMAKGQRVGMVYVCANYESVMRRYVWIYGGTAICVFMLSGLMGVALTRSMVGFITRPIANLAQVSSVITESRNYSLRAEKSDDDEIGLLTTTFNQMLEQIQKQDTALRETNSLQRAILDSAGYAIISTTRDGMIVTFNRAAERMLGYRTAEAVNRLPLTALHVLEEMEARARELALEEGGAAPGNFQAISAKAARGLPDEREWTYVRKDGNRFPVLLSMTALFDESGKVTGYLGIASEIADRKRVAEELKRAKESAESASQAKSEFLAMMSHEIRTPMNAIIGMTELLKDTPLNEEQREYVNTVGSSGDALLEIIDEILDFSKIEAGQLRLRLEPFEIPRLLQGVMDLLMPRARAKGLALAVEVSPEIPAVVRSDDGRLRQVLLNLVGNGIKFTERGEVRVVVSCAERAERRARIRFEVRDTGPGIEEDDQAQLFQAFTQLDRGSARRHGGTGLGLAISRRIVELFNGSIGVRSTPGAGSVFWFEIEVDVASWERVFDEKGAGSVPVARAAGPAASPIAPTGPLKVLVAEDHEPNRRLAALMLGKLGHRVEFVANGRQAVDAWEQRSPEVIFMDCQMPEMDGFEATREIRRREQARGASQTPRVRIIALTANALAGDRERCLAAGMDGYVSKPIRAEALAAALNRAAPSKPAGETAVETKGGGGLEASMAQLRGDLDDDSTRELITLFINDTPQRLSELRRLAAGTAPHAFARVAHSLAGSCGIFGLDSMSVLGLRLEEMGGRGEMAGVDPLIEELERAFLVHRVDLERIRAAIPAHQGGAPG